MTARAVHTRRAPVPVRAPAVASVALRQVLSRGDANAEVLGVSTHAVWIRAGGEVAVVSTRDATRLPNGVEIAAEASADPFGSIVHGDRVALGPTSIAFDGLIVEVARWWDPRPALPPLSAAELSVAIEGLPSSVGHVDCSDLRRALSGVSAVGLRGAASALLGRGPGLTPEGDDYLAGALAGIKTLGTALGSDEALEMLDAVGDHLARAARASTTTFSAALLRCAIRGEVAAPAGAFLRALTGRGDIEPAHRNLRSVGHSSGPALAAGIVLGAQSLIELHVTSNGGFK